MCAPFHFRMTPIHNQNSTRSGWGVVSKKPCCNEARTRSNDALTDTTCRLHATASWACLPRSSINLLSSSPSTTNEEQQRSNSHYTNEEQYRSPSSSFLLTDTTLTRSNSALPDTTLARRSPAHQHRAPTQLVHTSLTSLVSYHSTSG